MYLFVYVSILSMRSMCTHIKEDIFLNSNCCKCDINCNGISLLIQTKKLTSRNALKIQFLQKKFEMGPRKSEDVESRPSSNFVHLSYKSLIDFENL